ncbi:bifunctional 5,10-methylenetetrahydrofolate dehydrogenase/5,10-methenyltetrahydrofolate cyclohydrolase [Candidatus Gracilibacteria bacterium]|nr:bifunctional 5,10-methylenetetrahydrofolate dehydrogenase/5,10-methenyltetrahydrofolate cyclohydrolase [Candidatus Gracilibacteria bacterium]
MEAQILDGRLVSQSVLSQVEKDVVGLRSNGVVPKLIIILVGDNAGSISYIRQKIKAAKQVGIESEEHVLPEKTTTEQVISLINQLNKDVTVHGILVQLPLPRHIEVALVIRAIDPQKDVDGFHAYNIGKILISKDYEHLLPCTPQGIIAMLEFYKISLAGKHVVVVGRSNIVGKPLSILLLNRDATVTICHSKTPDVGHFTRQADIIVAAVGKPHTITADMVKDGAIVVDVGTNRVDGKMVGDVDFDEISKKAAWISPVPGGVGPMTVACLMKNVVAAATKLSSVAS